MALTKIGITSKYLFFTAILITCLFLTPSCLIAQKKAEKPMNEMWGTTANKQQANPDDNAAWFANAK